MVNQEPQSLHVIGDEDSAPEDGGLPNESVGAFLREARETTGRSVADVASSLRIRTSFLQSIEDGRYEDLPGQTYAIGFIRSYADYLGLETRTLVEQFKAQSSGREDDADLEFPAPSTEGWFPTGKVVAGCAALAAGVFVGWYFVQNRDAVDVAAVPTPPGYDSMIGAQASSGPAVNEEIQNAAVATTAEPAAPTEAPDGPSIAVASTALPDSPADAPPAPAGETMSAAADPSDTEPAPAAAVPATPEAAATEPEPRQAEVEPEQVAAAETPAPAAAEPTPKVIDSAAATTEPAAKVIDKAAATAEPVAVDAAELTPAAPAIAEAPPQPIEKPAVTAQAPAAPEAVTQLASLPAVPAVSGTADRGDDGRIYGVTNQESRVVIGARAESWVQVLDANQNVLLTRMLHPGDRYMVPNRNDLVMLTGNAGGLIISVDGEPVPRIGSDGAILHNVRLDVDLLKAGRAVIQ